MNKLIFLAIGVGTGFLISEIYYNIRLDKCIKTMDESTSEIEALTKQLKEIENARSEIHDTIKETQSEIEDLLSDL